MTTSQINYASQADQVDQDDQIIGQGGQTKPTGRTARSPRTGRPAVPPAKTRILVTADRLFYRVGIHTVGVDRLIKESKVTKATFYKHYRAKENLVLEYLNYRHEGEKRRLEQLVTEEADPGIALRALATSVVEDLQSPEFRGCPYINAAAEFPEARHPVRVLVTDHREWYAGLVSTVVGSLGHPLPGDATDDFVLARDGAMAGGYAGDPVAAAAAMQRAVERIIAEAKR